MDLPVEYSQHGGLLATMMRGVRDAAHHHPCAAALGLEELDFLLPPFGFLCRKQFDPPLRIFGIFFDEAQSRFFAGKRRTLKVDPEESSKPKILADTLMDHLLADATATAVGGVWSHVHVIVGEHAPHTDDFQALRSIRTHQEIVVHDGRFSRSLYMNHTKSMAC